MTHNLQQTKQIFYLEILRIRTRKDVILKFEYRTERTNLKKLKRAQPIVKAAKH
jgi:hypothetical protein